MYQEQILNYYSRRDIQKAILELAENREVVPVLASGGFGKRPNAVFYEKDVEQLVRQGAISLHGSVERWKNPLQLKTEMRTNELDELRIGWDLVIDIDCNRSIDYAKTATLVLVKALEDYGINSYSVKFSGNRGFHIAVPYESFPQEIMALGSISRQFPRMPRIVIEYLGEFIYKDLKESFNEEPKKVLSLDSQVISSRHLFRLPYCLHRKTWLASIPLKKDQIENFEKEQAKPENVKVDLKFLDRSAKENEALELLQSALFWNSRKQKVRKELDVSQLKLPDTAIKPDFFPPCMKNILNGLEDGRKRSVFVLITYLHHIGWKKEQIEQLLLSWNVKNKGPLREGTIKATLKNQFSRARPQMAPNCNNLGFYKDYGVCTPDRFCEIINNPVTYTLNKIRGLRRITRRGRRPVKKAKNG